MFIEYDEIDLLEFFEVEPVTIYDKESGKLMYVKEDRYGIKIIFYIDVYEQSCSFSINYKEFSEPIIEKKYISVFKIIRKSNELQILDKLGEIIFKLYLNYI